MFSDVIKTFLFLIVCVLSATDGVRLTNLPKNSNKCGDTLARRTPRELKQSDNIDIVRGIKMDVLNIAEDADLTITQLVSKYGYPMEVHNIQTKDGYILTIHRIPFGKHKRIGGRSVLVLHGLLGSSDDWVVTGPEKGLGYVLADAGYDVWLGNVRGNKHGKNHTRLTNTGHEFWKFTLEEIALFDLAAMFDYVLEKTNKSQVFYTAHSQGTVLFFILCSLRPIYNEKVSLAVLLAPVAWSSHATSPLWIFLLKISGALDLASNFAPNGEFFPSSDLLKLAGMAACNNRLPTQAICSNILFMLYGHDEDQMNGTLLPVILAHNPAGCATRQIAHFGQNYEKNTFASYDYGLLENFIRYGSAAPPRYPLEKVSAPVMLAYGRNDGIADPQDVKRLRGDLTNVVEFYEVPHLKFNHIDFLWANDVNVLLYDKVLETMAMY